MSSSKAFISGGRREQQCQDGLQQSGVSHPQTPRGLPGFQASWDWLSWSRRCQACAHSDRLPWNPGRADTCDVCCLMVGGENDALTLLPKIHWSPILVAMKSIVEALIQISTYLLLMSPDPVQIALLNRCPGIHQILTERVCHCRKMASGSVRRGKARYA